MQDEKIRIDTGMELIEIYSGTGDLDKAAATVSALRKLDPTNVALLYTAYRIYSDLADESLLSLSVVAPIPHACIRRWRMNWPSVAKPKKPSQNYRDALKLDPTASRPSF